MENTFQTPAWYLTGRTVLSAKAGTLRYADGVLSFIDEQGQTHFTYRLNEIRLFDVKYPAWRRPSEQGYVYIHVPTGKHILAFNPVKGSPFYVGTAYWRRNDVGLMYATQWVEKLTALNVPTKLVGTPGFLKQYYLLLNVAPIVVAIIGFVIYFFIKLLKN